MKGEFLEFLLYYIRLKELQLDRNWRQFQSFFPTHFPHTILFDFTCQKTFNINNKHTIDEKKKKKFAS